MRRCACPMCVPVCAGVGSVGLAGGKKGGGLTKSKKFEALFAHFSVEIGLTKSASKLPKFERKRQNFDPQLRKR